MFTFLSLVSCIPMLVIDSVSSSMSASSSNVRVHNLNYKLQMKSGSAKNAAVLTLSPHKVEGAKKSQQLKKSVEIDMDSEDVNTPVKRNNKHTVAPMKRPLFCTPKVSFLLWRNSTAFEAEITSPSRFSLLSDIINALLFSRTILVLIAEQNVLSAGSLGHLMMVTIPFYITIEHMVYRHDRLLSNYDLLHFIFVAVRTGVVFCLSWNAPSSFVSSIANLPSFTLAVLFGRTLVVLYSVFTAAYDSEASKQLLFNASLQLLPICTTC
jgi:hypothetical protein